MGSQQDDLASQVVLKYEPQGLEWDVKGIQGAVLFQLVKRGERTFFLVITSSFLQYLGQHNKSKCSDFSTYTQDTAVIEFTV